jgi:bisphosphoglycerate-dependent phosphoglycerate mutase
MTFYEDDISLSFCAELKSIDMFHCVQGVLSEEEIPRTESLQDLVERTLPLWRKGFNNNH